MSEEVGTQTSTLPQTTRVLHLISDLRGPVGSHAVGAVRAQLRAGLHVAVATSKALFRSLELPASPLLVHIPLTVDSGSSLRDPLVMLELARRYPHIDVVHAHGFHPAALAAGAIVGFPSPHKPVLIASIARFDPQGLGQSAKLAAIRRETAAVLYTGESVRRQFAGFGPELIPLGSATPDVVEPISPTLSRANVRAELDIPSGIFIVATAMTLSDGDELTTFLDTAMHFFAHRPDRRVVFVLAGSGPDRGEVAELFNSEAHPVVVAPPGNALDVLAVSDVVVATADMSGLDPAELLQLRRPIVSLGTARTAQAYGEAAMVAAPASTDELMHAVEVFLDKPAARGKAIAAAQAQLAGDGHELTARDLHSVYTRALRLTP